MIKANNLYYSYKDVEVLKGISLDIKRGEFVSITRSFRSWKNYITSFARYS